MRTILARATFAFVTLSSFAFAQSYPNRPLRLIVPYTSGSTDTVSRIYGLKLAEGLGQQVVIDNRPGGAANIGAELAARAPADGYTLLIVSISHTVNVSLYKKLGYDLVKDFAPISRLSSNPFVLVVHPSLPAKSPKELVVLAQARPGQINYASSGSSTYLAMELFGSMSGIRMNNIPYKGGGPAAIALLGGQVEAGMISAQAALANISAGKLRGLAVTSAKRSSAAPNLPTIDESGVPGYEVTSWVGVLAPAATRKEIIARLNAETMALLAKQDTLERLRTADAEPAPTTPEQFAAYMRSEIDKWAKVVKASGVPVE